VSIGNEIKGNFFKRVSKRKVSIDEGVALIGDSSEEKVDAKEETSEFIFLLKLDTKLLSKQRIKLVGSSSSGSDLRGVGRVERPRHEIIFFDDLDKGLETDRLKDNKVKSSSKSCACNLIANVSLSRLTIVLGGSDKVVDPTCRFIRLRNIIWTKVNDL